MEAARSADPPSINLFDSPMEFKISLPVTLVAFLSLPREWLNSIFLLLNSFHKSAKSSSVINFSSSKEAHSSYLVLSMSLFSLK